MSNSGSLLAFSLDADLVDCLLTALSDFQSLQAFILSSKFIYSVFRCRQNSILRAVAHNQLGPALPQAMRLARYLGGTYSLGLTHKLHREADFAKDFTVTPSQARLLRDHAVTIRALEDIYSWREKDPRSRSSRLSTAESLRFQKSVYGFWLLTVVFGPGADERLGYDNDELEGLFISKQIASLLGLEETELLGVDEVHAFLLNLARWALMKHTTQCRRFGNRDDIYLVWNGPAVTLDAFRRGPFLPIDPHWYGSWQAMTRASFASEVASITSGGALLATRRHFILDGHFLETVDCSRCKGSSTLSERDSLWSSCNWPYMTLAIAPSTLAGFLSSERRGPLELLVSFTEETKSISYSQLIKEIFDVRSEPYRDWKRDDWLCTRCMTKLLSDSIQTWFDKRVTPEVDAINLFNGRVLCV